MQRQKHWFETYIPLAVGALVVAAVAVFGAAPVAAQTPDGLPPALETVCDKETGSAFGWCNAYCEAMDCELANDSDPATQPKASATACNKVRTKFQQATARDLPCEVATCPCTDNPTAFPIWTAYITGQAAGSQCLQDAQVCTLFLGVPPELCTPPQGDITFVLLAETQYLVLASSLGVEGHTPPVCGSVADAVIPLSPAQGAVCKAQLDAVLAASGLVCGV